MDKGFDAIILMSNECTFVLGNTCIMNTASTVTILVWEHKNGKESETRSTIIEMPVQSMAKPMNFMLQTCDLQTIDSSNLVC
jgi:hypothetical protein